MKFFALLVLSLMFTACGDSPLLNHSMEKAGLESNNFGTLSEGHHFAKSKFSFKLEWIVGPVKGENKFVMKTWHDELGSFNGPFQDLPNTLNVYLWMRDMGHGSAPVKIKKLNQGEYEISNAYFIMPGNWEIYFQLLKNKDDVLDEVILPLTL